MKSSCLVRLGIFLLVAAACSFCFAQTYTMTDLGVISGMDYSVGRAINASAQTTGASGTNNSNMAHVFVNTNGIFTDLGTLGGNTGVGNGINSSGQVAGYSTNASGTYRAFISNGDAMVDIGDLGGGSAVAYAINDPAQVVGSAVTADGSNHPFLYSKGKMIDIGTLGSPSGTDWWNSAQGVNNAGMVTGSSYTATAGLRAFVWSNGKMKRVRSLGGDWAEAFAINNNGQITGISTTKNGNSHAYLANPDGTIKDLGSIGGKFGTTWGFAINDNGVVVGQGTTSQNSYHAFVYNGTRIRDLNTLVPKGSGWTLYEARGINNAGQILCTAMNAAGAQHAFLLTPKN